jgi:hypothetical protein
MAIPKPLFLDSLMGIYGIFNLTFTGVLNER